MLKRSLFAVSLILSVLLLASCTVNAPHEKGYSFVDALGRKVVIEHTPERVGALLGSFADVWVLSGGNVCAAPEDAWEDFGLELDAVNIGGAHSPSLEMLISADPDFVIASASTPSNVEMLEALEQMGIKVAYFDVDSFDDYLEMLRICTEITGRGDLYQKNGIEIKNRIDELKSTLPEDMPRIFLIRVSSGTVKAKSSEGTILGEMLSELGCINIADSDTTLLESLSVERVLQENPYHIFAVTMGDDVKSMENFKRMLEDNPVWKTLDAIREGRIHFMDRKLFNIKPNSRWAESYEQLISILQNN